MVETALVLLFAGIAIGCAIAMVVQKNPLYSAIALVGTFIGLSALYLTLASPFIAVTQILVYAGAIMVLVVFVIMLLNVEEGLPDKNRLKSLPLVGAALGLLLLAQGFFIFYAVNKVTANNSTATANPTMGLTQNIGLAMFTEYLLPFEIVGILLLMAIVGAMVMSRRLPPEKLEQVVEAEREIRNQEDFN